MLTINLNIDGKDTQFQVPFVKGRMLRRTIEMQPVLQKNVEDPETLDSMVDYVCEVFGNKFTRDQFYDGIDSAEIITEIRKVQNRVVGVVNNSAGHDPKNV